MLTDEEFKEGLKPCMERHNPNPETLEALESGIRGAGTTVGSVEELFTQLRCLSQS
jgi:hypothetical protein